MNRSDLVEGSGMKTAVMILSGVMAFSTPVLAPTSAEASIIERACNASDRSAASRSLCRCIQNVANSELTRADQRKAAKFFSDPHKAQETRQSDNRSTEAFWLRYKAFGNTAEERCS